MVTKQEQLEWLAKNYESWAGINFKAVRMSSQIIGNYNQGAGYHTITREEWQQERNRMQKQDNESECVVKRNQQNEQDNSWYGHGELPPVGCECEFVMCDNEDFYRAKHNLPNTGDTVKIVAHHKFYELGAGVAVFVWLDGENGRSATGTNILFRPLRTEREKAIDDMKSLCAYPGSWCSTFKAFAESLYDAGYRKVSQ